MAVQVRHLPYPVHRLLTLAVAVAVMLTVLVVPVGLVAAEMVEVLLSVQRLEPLILVVAAVLAVVTLKVRETTVPLAVQVS
jgi:hypothetical protein